MIRYNYFYLVNF